MHRNADITRRRWLHAFGLNAAALGALASPIGPVLAAPPPETALTRKRLIFFALYGGNDGLNTVVPYRDPLYRRLRPTLALEPKTLLPLSDDLALHPRMAEFMKMFQAGEVALVQDVGYPQPSLSHFESAAIWESAHPHRESRTSGWYGELVMRNRSAFEAARFDAAAVSFDRSMGFADGHGVPVLLAGQNVFEASGKAGPAQRARIAPDAPAVANRLAALVNEGHEVRERFAARLKGVALPKWKPYEEPLEVQTKLADWFITHGASTPLIRLCQDGYDMHSGLIERHDDLLRNFDAALARLKRDLKAAGAWDDTVVMVHSEFGRRAAENGHRGTDHGSAGPVFLIGGKVRGGIYGQRARLDELDGEGNLKFTTDFRRVYSTLVRNLWALPNNPLAADGFAPLDIGLA